MTSKEIKNKSLEVYPKFRDDPEAGKRESYVLGAEFVSNEMSPPLMATYEALEIVTEKCNQLESQLSALQKELAEKERELEALREWKKTQLEIWGELYSTKRLVTDLREAIYLNDGEKAISLLNEYEQSHPVETKPVYKCGDCGLILTEVRPGKHQCDNIHCKVS